MFCAASVKSNKSLWNGHPDKSASCSIFTALPRLRTMSLYFFPTIEEEEWIGSILAWVITMEEFG